MTAVERTTKATRTMSGSWRRCAAVPTATPASTRPERGRASGGRGAPLMAGGPATGVVTFPIVAPPTPARTPVITRVGDAAEDQGRMGAFPDGSGSAGEGRF